jgi:putative RNA 2'-phosphotransferase
MPAPVPSVRLSKLLSLMLRHRPKEFSLEVDSQGFADLEGVVEALQKKVDGIGIADIEGIVDGTEKKRFEIVEGKIRARYGHSFRVDLGVDPVEPPVELFKGVHPRELQATLSSGLKPFDRQYVHLSYDADVAAQLGRGGNAVVRVDGPAAFAAGVEFFDCGPTMLTELVPAEFLTLEREAPDRPVSSDRPSRPERRSSTPAPRVTPDTTQEPEKSEAPQYGRRRTFRRR